MRFLIRNWITLRRFVRCAVPLSVAVACCWLTADLSAQGGVALAELRGRVFLAGDTVSLAGAHIQEVGSTLNATAGPDGSYRLVGLSLGRHAFLIRLIGLASRSVVVDVDSPGVRTYNIAMSRLPTTLAEIRIKGEYILIPPRLKNVYHRMQTQWGTFFTREDIAKRNPYNLLSLLAWVPTARVTDDGISFAKCTPGGAYALSMDRHAPSGVQIYIDGFRAAGDSQREILQRLHPSDVQAVEVYNGVARIPGEFLDDACAVIAIWTR